MDLVTLLTAFCGLTLLISLMASSGRSFGFSDFVISHYVKFLRALFDWGRVIKETEEASSEADRYSQTRESRASILQSPRPSLTSADAEPDRVHSVILDGVAHGVQCIVHDEVTQRFDAEELSSWNLLTRTHTNYQFLSVKLTLIWTAGFFFRYFVLLPFRIALFGLGFVFMLMGMTFLGLLEPGPRKAALNKTISLAVYRVLMRTCSGIIRFHDEENRPKSGIVVANHTSPIDCIVLSVDNCYSFVGQSHGGILGIFQNALQSGASHVWFDRTEGNDRIAVSRRLVEHVSQEGNLPVLLFPEGTCVNNTSIMMFKKGVFEMDTVIYPVAIKYDAIFADPFWNSSKESMMSHVLNMMTSWALVCDVYYLPPCRRDEGEDAVQFSLRVKHDIAVKGGLIELEWDGQWKRSAPARQLDEKRNEFKGLVGVKMRGRRRSQVTEKRNERPALSDIKERLLTDPPNMQ